MANANKKLSIAKGSKNDEFYTTYEDIKAELIHYAKYFKGKVIYCNCDDHNGIGLGTPKSNFLKYLADNFEAFGIKKVIATHYEKNKNSSTMYVLNKDNTGNNIAVKTHLKLDRQERRNIRERAVSVGDGDAT